jgi:hypothetical protein
MQDLGWNPFLAVTISWRDNIIESGGLFFASMGDSKKTGIKAPWHASFLFFADPQSL